MENLVETNIFIKLKNFPPVFHHTQTRKRKKIANKLKLCQDFFSQEIDKFIFLFIKGREREKKSHIGKKKKSVNTTGTKKFAEV